MGEFLSASSRSRTPAAAAIVGLFLLALGIVGGFALRHATSAAAPGLLRVTFLDVGQGDATVIEGPTGRVVVVDGGGHPGTDESDGRDPGSRVVVPFLRSRGLSTVDLLVPTHPDDDHVQGLIAVTKRLTVSAALDGGYGDSGGDSGAYGRLHALLLQRHIPIFTARRGQRIDIGGGARLEVLNPPPYPVAGQHSQTNNNSVVLRLVYGRARILLTGDAETEAEGEMLGTARDLSADVLKVGHHGSRWSTTEPFLDRVHPTVAVVSAGEGNNYGHPHRETLERLTARGVRVFRTDQQGAVTVETNGRRIGISTMR